MGPTALFTLVAIIMFLEVFNNSPIFRKIVGVVLGINSHGLGVTKRRSFKPNWRKIKRMRNCGYVRVLCFLVRFHHLKGEGSFIEYPYPDRF